MHKLQFHCQFRGSNLLHAKLSQCCNGTVRCTDHLTSWDLWIKPDSTTASKLQYRTWFYFGVSQWKPGLVRFVIKNMNKQQKLFALGWKPAVQTSSCSSWKQIDGLVDVAMTAKSAEVTFFYQFPADGQCADTTAHDAIVYFALTCPFSYEQIQEKLSFLQTKFPICVPKSESRTTEVFCCSEVLCHQSMCNIDLLTISSFDGLTEELEDNFPGLFPFGRRCPKFRHKKICFITARVHPGEVCSSHVMNGVIKFLTDECDPRARKARELFVFKIIPMLNPEGVILGHYRTDRRGENLNRVYINPSLELHPSIFATKQLILYYHNNYSLVELSAQPIATLAISPSHRQRPVVATAVRLEALDGAAVKQQTLPSKACMSPLEHLPDETSFSRCSNLTPLLLTPTAATSALCKPVATLKPPPLSSKKTTSRLRLRSGVASSALPILSVNSSLRARRNLMKELDACETEQTTSASSGATASSGLAFYIDLHGHISKSRCFLYGNYLPKAEQIETAIFAKLISINCPYFDLNGCVFSPELRDENQGRDGAGRVCVYRSTGLIHSYTFECNYFAGKCRNKLAPATNDLGKATPPSEDEGAFVFSTDTYETVGKALVVSMLDYAKANPWSRLPNVSNLGTSQLLRGWADAYVRRLHRARAKIRQSVLPACLPSSNENATEISIGEQRTVLRARKVTVRKSAENKLRAANMVKVAKACKPSVSGDVPASSSSSFVGGEFVLSSNDDCTPSLAVPTVKPKLLLPRSNSAFACSARNSATVSKTRNAVVPPKCPAGVSLSTSASAAAVVRNSSVRSSLPRRPAKQRSRPALPKRTLSDGRESITKRISSSFPEEK